MLSLSDSEEILAIVIAVFIVMGFAYSTYSEIKATIAEEKEKIAEEKAAEQKVKTLIEYLNAKTRLINSINAAKKKLEKRDLL